ncbi:hypothetical protein B0A49_12566 [Cryomyces minteri]|uniref:Uncharacterized protein n=1 Tax=Cryomyces minteri TaxID=331657 RepID=A0A4U0WGX4_9PEZI|nr:hypothetical protein B0A49_12566 [Cryomyces minteri]
MSPRPIDSASSAQEYLRSLIPLPVPNFSMQAAARRNYWSSGPFLYAHTTAADRALINSQNSTSLVDTAESSTVGGRSGYVGDAESEVGDARLADYAGKVSDQGECLYCRHQATSRRLDGELASKVHLNHDALSSPISPAPPDLASAMWAPPVQTANRKKVSQNLTKKSDYWGDEVDDEEDDALWETTAPSTPVRRARRFHIQPATKRIDQSGIQEGTEDLPSAFSASSSEGDRPVTIAGQQTVAPELPDRSLSLRHSPTPLKVPSPFAHGLTAEDLLEFLSTTSPNDETAAGIPIPSRPSGVTDVDAEEFLQCTTVASALSSVPGFRRVVVATSVLLL